jgi:Tfp pilus assembly protein PilO
MNDLSKTDKERLVLVVLCTGMLAVTIWQFVIQPSQIVLHAKQRDLDVVKEALRAESAQAALAGKLQNELNVLGKEIRKKEALMATGDPYRWIMKTMLDFPESGRIELTAFDPPQINDFSIFPKLPYRMTTFAVRGRGYYHDFGVFLAALERSYPHLRVKRLDLEPQHSMQIESEDDEKLSFRLEFTCLLRTNSAAGDIRPEQITSAKP